MITLHHMSDQKFAEPSKMETMHETECKIGLSKCKVRLFFKSKETWISCLSSNMQIEERRLCGHGQRLIYWHGLQRRETSAL